MAKTLVRALALATLPSTLAFRNTSPFFLFSTADLDIHSAHDALVQGSDLTTHILESLKNCPSRAYIVVEQKGVSSADYFDGRATPRLTRSLTGKQEDIKSSMVFPEVVGQVNAQEIITHLKSKCGAQQVHSELAPINQQPEDASPQLFNKALTPLSTTPSDRIAMLRGHDQWLDELILSMGDSNDYTVIYHTAAQTEEDAEATLRNSYQMEDPFAEVTQMELKRDTSSHKGRRASSSKEGGLFEKYQYFTPGLFMGFAAIIPLFLILLVGIKALTSLEVSYFAFSKEMGPNAQKKQ